LRALEIDELLTAPRATLGLVRLAQGDLAAARTELDRSLVLDPDNAVAWRGLGDLFVRQGSMDEAEAHYRRALAAAPEDQELYGALGSYYYRLGRGGDAAAAFARSIELAPDYFGGYKNLAAAYHMEGKYAEAAAQLQRALEIEPDPTVYTNLGTLYFFQGLYQDAVSALERALELGANDYRVWGNLGDAYRWVAGKEQAAADAHSRAIQLLRDEVGATPDDPYLRSLLAAYLAKRGDAAAALAELDALEGVADKDYETFYNSIQASEVAGARERALTLLRQAMTEGHTLVEVAKDPELAELRSDVRYHRLLSELETRGEDAE
jgi:tetratricopeptide (TPR) repeat protein